MKGCEGASGPMTDAAGCKTWNRHEFNNGAQFAPETICFRISSPSPPSSCAGRLTSGCSAVSRTSSSNETIPAREARPTWRVVQSALTWSNFPFHAAISSVSEPCLRTCWRTRAPPSAGKVLTRFRKPREAPQTPSAVSANALLDLGTRAGTLGCHWLSAADAVDGGGRSRT
jgi:hypothetical protein